jgi:hypothetical protein
MALLHGRAGRLTAQNRGFWRGQEESKAAHAANKAALVKAIGAASDTSAPLARRLRPGQVEVALQASAGTAVLLDHNMFHRGTRRMPGALWRCMFKPQFLCVNMPAAPGWDTASRSPDPGPFVGLGRDAVDEAVWTAVWHWLRGERPVERPGPGRPGAFKRPQRFPI